MRGLPAHAILFTVRLKQRANKPQKIQMTIESSLKASIARWFPGATGIDRLAQLSGGASQETWSFDVLHPEENIAVILRRAPSGYGAAPGRAAGLEAEAVLMQ